MSEEELFASLPSQGAKAVRSGRFGELTPEAGFGAHGVPAVDDNPGYHNETQFWERRDKILIRQVPIKFRKVDYLYKDYARKISLPIECKQQMGNGTTDEKLAYTVDRLYECGYPIFWLVLSGDGFAITVVEEIRRKIDRLDGKGRLIINKGPYLQRAIEYLVDRGKPSALSA